MLKDGHSKNTCLGDSRQVYLSSNLCWFQIQLTSQQVGYVIEYMERI